MARSSTPRRGSTPGSVRRRPGRAAACVVCSTRTDWVDYTDVALLRRFVGPRGTIRARRATGTCARHQAEVAVAVKTARELALLPYAAPAAVRTGAARGGRRHARTATGEA
jgi:small subunit ribosomal protein S18